jgi:hypothetical protein
MVLKLPVSMDQNAVIPSKVWIQNGNHTAENDRYSICKTRYSP